MKHLRQYIRQILLESPELQDELDELIHNREDHAYTIGLGTSHREYQKMVHHYRPADQVDKTFDLRREVKKFWNKNADHQFWQDPTALIVVHDLTYYSQLGDPDDPKEATIAKSGEDIQDKDLPIPMFMKKYPPGKMQKDEMSAYGFIGPFDGIFPLEFDLGIVLAPRRVTYASVVDAYTESRGQASWKDKKRHKSSGLPKRPTVGKFMQGRHALFDESDVKRAEKIGEIVVDNWTYDAVVLNVEQVNSARMIIEVAKAKGLKVFHSKTGKEL